MFLISSIVGDTKINSFLCEGGSTIDTEGPTILGGAAVDDTSEGGPIGSGLGW